MGETVIDASLRELEEELAMPPSNVKVIGSLTPLYVFSSNHYVTPVVGVALSQPTFRPNAREVARVLEAPLAHLGNPENLSSFEGRFGGMSLKRRVGIGTASRFGARPRWCWPNWRRSSTRFWSPTPRPS